MTLNTMLALFAAMALLAAVPSLSVMTVAARAAACGFVHGALVALGVVVGDVLFILVALLGLSLLAETLGGWFVLVKYAGAAYLIWLGVTLWRASPGSEATVAEGPNGASRVSSFASGLLLTLGDQKAIFFYLGFFPVFVDLSRVTLLDTGVIIAIAIVAVGGVKLVYAYLAHRVGALVGARAYRALNIAAGIVLVAAGSFIMVTVRSGS